MRVWLLPVEMVERAVLEPRLGLLLIVALLYLLLLDDRGAVELRGVQAQGGGQAMA